MNLAIKKPEELLWEWTRRTTQIFKEGRVIQQSKSHTRIIGGQMEKAIQ